MLAKVGCQDYRVVSQSPVSIVDPKIEAICGKVRFSSMTIRAFKIALEDRCEDYGQVAIYQGSIPECPGHFILDDHHVFETEKTIPVCRNTAMMLQESRYAPHFKIIGNGTKHFGLFDCGPSVTSKSTDDVQGACC